jgi:uncharacterized peroxidase-related enzyme
MAHIQVIQENEATGQLREVYDHLIGTRGKLAEVHKIQSLNPSTIMQHMTLYMGIMFGKSPLKRYQREMMAVVVSRANGCEYCQVHHAEALQHFWKDEAKVERLRTNYLQVDLSIEDRVLCDYAFKLTKEPASAADTVLVEDLKQVGFDDRAILDASLVIGYFNFVNRVVSGLGVDLEEQPGNFKYD